MNVGNVTMNDNIIMVKILQHLSYQPAAQTLANRLKYQPFQVTIAPSVWVDIDNGYTEKLLLWIRAHTLT